MNPDAGPDGDDGTPDRRERARAVERRARARLSLREEAVLALLPTLTVLLVLWLMQAFAHERVVFASLASSAFLIYADPLNPMNLLRTVALAQVGCALVGAACLHLLGAGYVAAGAAMVVGIGALVTLDLVHPPAIGTALGFAFRQNADANLAPFLAAVLLVVCLAATSLGVTAL